MRARKLGVTPSNPAPTPPAEAITPAVPEVIAPAPLDDSPSYSPPDAYSSSGDGAPSELEAALESESAWMWETDEAGGAGEEGAVAAPDGEEPIFDEGAADNPEADAQAEADAIEERVMGGLDLIGADHNTVGADVMSLVSSFIPGLSAGGGGGGSSNASGGDAAKVQLVRLQDAKKRAEEDAKKADERALLYRNLLIGLGALAGFGILSGVITIQRKG